MTSTNIPYEQRQLGQFYYCQSSQEEHHYIFQCDNLEGDKFPSLHNIVGQDWGNQSIDTYSSFKSDWESGKDRILRLATP